MTMIANAGNADLLIVDPKAQYRSSLRYTLNALNFSQMQFGARVGDIRYAMGKRLPDLMITDSDLPDGDVCNLIRTIRVNQACPNPFLSIIVITWNPTRELVQRVIDSGADDLLVQPISTRHMRDRIELLTYNRKPFVVTATYIGPDRRSARRFGSEQIPVIEVPNMLKAKITGTHDPQEMKQAIRQTIKQINQEKLKRNACHLPYIAEKIQTEIFGGADRRMVQADLNELVSTARDFLARAKNTPFEHFSEMCQAMFMLASKLRAASEKPSAKNLDLLLELSRGIQVAFDAGRTPATAVR